MYIKQSNLELPPRPFGPPVEGKGSQRILFPRATKKTTSSLTAAATGAVGSHRELAKHVGFTPQLAATKNQTREVKMLKAPAQKSEAGAPVTVTQDTEQHMERALPTPVIQREQRGSHWNQR